MRAVRHAMGDDDEKGPTFCSRDELAVLGRVAMALLGDGPEVERVLETVAREQAPAEVKRLPWLLGKVRIACATKLSKIPLRTRPLAQEDNPARSALGTLPPTEREAVVLTLVGGLDAADVALACNVDEATAKGRIARGLEQLLAHEKTSGGAP